jgi:hypothetical protein
MNKFEQLIEFVINDEEQKARELFHDIVVEKSRAIYESLMNEEADEEIEEAAEEEGGREEKVSFLDVFLSKVQSLEQYFDTPPGSLPEFSKKVFLKKFNLKIRFEKNLTFCLKYFLKLFFISFIS